MISSPLDKLLLVRQLKEISEVVVVTSDGTNMGIQGISFAKECSNITIMDDTTSNVPQHKGIRPIPIYYEFVFYINFEALVNGNPLSCL